MHYTVDTVSYTVNNVQYTVQNVHYTVHTVHYKANTVHCDTIQFRGQFVLSANQEGRDRRIHSSKHDLLHSTAFFCIALDCHALYCTHNALYGFVFHCNKLHISAVPCTSFHCNAMHCTLDLYILDNSLIRRTFYLWPEFL